MRNFLSALALIVAAACSEPAAPLHVESSWPAGSKIGTICFEHETDGGWAPAPVATSDGGAPVKGGVVAGVWFFPMDAGQLRLRSCW